MPIRMPILQRLLFHALLAFFLANAANKFFVPDLEFELSNGFYAKIFEFKGDAPDQWRILPLLPLKWLCDWMPFNTATLLYNFLTGWLCLELIWRLTRLWPKLTRLLISTGFALAFIYLQYTGWRPDTLALLVVCMLALLPLEMQNSKVLRATLLALGIAALSFSRADIALIYAIFMAFWLRQWGYALLCILPILIQLALRFWIFPDASYYTQTFMLTDNLSMKYLVRNPATALILALIVGFAVGKWSKIWEQIKENSYFYMLLSSYLLLVLLVGRLNEYRLYLPFLPLFLYALNGRNHHKRKPSRPL